MTIRTVAAMALLLVAGAASAQSRLPSETIGVAVESSPPGLYVPVICTAGFCSGPSDPAYEYPTLDGCKSYIVLGLHLRYIVKGETPPAGRPFGFCLYHASDWQRAP